MSTPFKTSRLSFALTAAALVALTGCASKGPQGYGVADQSTAAQAQQQMEKAELSTQVDSQQTYLDLIAQMQKANQWYASLAHTDAFERQYGNTAQIRLLRADALRNTDQATQAKDVYLALLKNSDTTTTARAHRGLGLLYASQREFKQAVEQLEAARQLNPIDADVLSDLAYAQMLDGQVSAASLPIQQAAQLAPTNARVQLNLALYLIASGSQNQANQLLGRLRQPQAKNAAPLVDEQSLQTLQAQLAVVREAVRARAQADEKAAITQPAEPTQARPPAAPTEARRTIVIGSLPPSVNDARAMRTTSSLSAPLP